MSINAVKAVSIGDGFDVITRKGSENRDERTAAAGFLTNHAGGILGGISSGQPIIARAAFKATSSILVPGRSTDRDGQDVEMINMADINAAYERMLKSDVKYRFVIDIATL